MLILKGSPLIDGFIEMNPMFEINKNYQAIIEKYGEEEADKLFWAIAMIEYPNEDFNPYYSMLRPERIKEVKANYYAVEYIKDETIPNSKYEDTMLIADTFTRFLGKEQKLFASQEKKLTKVTLQLNEMEIDPNDIKSYKMYSTVTSTIDKVWRFYATLKDKFEKEINKKSHTFGDTELSVAEERARG